MYIQYLLTYPTAPVCVIVLEDLEPIGLTDLRAEPRERGAEPSRDVV